MKQNILIFNSATLWKNQLNGMIEIISKELNRKITFLFYLVIVL